MKLNALIILLLIAMLGPATGKAQCKFEHTLKVEQSSAANSGGRILVASGESRVEFKLYGVKNGEITLLESKKVSMKGKKSPTIVFESLKPGKYHVLAEWGNCKSGVGGVEGITIN